MKLLTSTVHAVKFDAVVQNCFRILVLERIREQIDIFQGSMENEKLQGSKREKMQGAQEKIRREQGEWTKIRREQGARTPPLRVSLEHCLSRSSGPAVLDRPYGIPSGSTYRLTRPRVIPALVRKLFQ